MTRNRTKPRDSTGYRIVTTTASQAIGYGLRAAAWIERIEEGRWRYIPIRLQPDKVVTIHNDSTKAVKVTPRLKAGACDCARRRVTIGRLTGRPVGDRYTIPDQNLVPDVDSTIQIGIQFIAAGTTDETGLR